MVEIMSWYKLPNNYGNQKSRHQISNHTVKYKQSTIKTTLLINKNVFQYIQIITFVPKF